MQFKDQLNTVFELQESPKRIICLVPSLTELLVDLGLESLIVGVTKFCVHPNHLKKTKTIVGGTKNIKIDKIRALKPDLILCNKEENTKDIVEKCRKIAVTHVSDIYTITDTLALINQYGKLFSCEEKAAEIILKIEQKKDSFLNFISSKKKIKSIYFIWKNPWMIAANNTFINHLLQLNKFDNAFKNLERYPEIDLTLKDNDIDLVLLSSEPYPFKEKDLIELKKDFNKSKIILVDGEFFSWYGTRLIKAFDYFKTIHSQMT